MWVACWEEEGLEVVDYWMKIGIDILEYQIARRLCKLGGFQPSRYAVPLEWYVIVTHDSFVLAQSRIGSAKDVGLRGLAGSWVDLLQC